jgi:hypothetical protein
LYGANRARGGLDAKAVLAWAALGIPLSWGIARKRRQNLSLRYAAPLAAQQKIAPHGGAFANATGLAFIVLAITIIVIAGWRFVQTAKDINT